MKSKYIIILIAILFLTSCNSTNEEKLNGEAKVEVYSNHLLSEFDEDVKDDYYIDTSEIKEYEIKYKTNNDKLKKVAVKVADTTPPYIGIGNKYTYIIGEKFTLLDSTFCGDNYDKNIDCTLIGEYDLNKEGTYNLKIKGEDKSGNIKEKDFTLYVMNKRKTESKKEKLSLDEINKRNIDDAELLIDVSKWQGEIDFEKVKKAGINYVILRLGTQKGIGLESKIDEKFEKNYEKATKAGLKVGVYYFSYAKNVKEARKQAEFVIETLKDKKIDLPVAFDWECWEYFNRMDISIQDLNELADIFLKTVEESGRNVMLYGSKNYLENVWNLNYDIWLAHYTENTNYSGEKTIWQFANNALIPGIDGNVDINFYYGNK